MKTEDNQQPTTSTFSAAQWPQASQIPIDPALQQQSQHTQQHTTHPTHTAHTAHAAHTAHTAHTTHPTTTPYTHYQYGHYAQTGYTHYPQYAQQAHQAQAAQPVQAQTQVQQQQPQQVQQQPTVASIPTAPRPATTQPAQTQQQSSAIDTTDVATLNDALGSAGVDLRAEEETLQRSNDNYYSYRPYEDRSRKQPTKPNFDTRILGQTMRTIGTQHKVPKIPEDAVNYVALALRTRLQDLLTAMIAAAQHRADAQFDRPASTYEDGRPMWSVVVRADVAKQLAALEKAEREEEMRIRRERKERQDAAAAAQNAALTASSGGGAGADSGAGGDEEGGPKKKKKKEGPGVTARNMPEDLRKKMSNAVAKQAAGLGTSKYAWMTSASGSASNGAATPAKAKPAASTSRASTPATTTAPAASASAGGGWARPYQSSKPNAQQQQQQKEEDGRLAVTLRDAMFVIENEKGHGGGRGAARGWT